MRLYCEGGRGNGEVKPHGIILWGLQASDSCRHNTQTHRHPGVFRIPSKMKPSTKENDGWVDGQYLWAKTRKLSS